MLGSSLQNSRIGKWQWAISGFQWSMGLALFFRTGHISMPSGNRRCEEQPMGYGMGRGFCSLLGILSGAQPDCHPVWLHATLTSGILPPLVLNVCDQKK